MRDEIDYTVGVAELVVVPRDQLDEILIQRDARIGVENRRSGAANKVR